MDGSRRSQGPLRAVRAGRIQCAFLLALGLGAGGCADHRIGLDQFLEMQKKAAEQEPVGPDTVKPSANQTTLEALVDQKLGPYRVGVGDVLGVLVATADTRGATGPFQVRVGKDGKIRAPLAGEVSVAGLPLLDVEEAVRNAYVPKVYRDASVNVTLVEPEVTNVLVVGAVTSPGLVNLRRTERNLLYAIVAAGGVSEAASGEATLRRLRRPKDEVTLTLTDPEQLKQALQLNALENGDIVTVHAAVPNQVFVGGLVSAPRPQIYPQGVRITVLQAIAAAGGLRTDVTPREATLIRRMPDGQDVHVKLNLDRLTIGKDPNIELAAGDILWVPDTLETRFQDWFNRNIFFRAGVSANVTYNVSGVEYMNRAGQQSTGGRGGNVEQSFDPFGFLNRGAALRQLTP